MASTRLLHDFRILFSVPSWKSFESRHDTMKIAKDFERFSFLALLKLFEFLVVLTIHCLDLVKSQKNHPRVTQCRNYFVLLHLILNDKSLGEIIAISTCKLATLKRISSSNYSLHSDVVVAHKNYEWAQIEHAAKSQFLWVWGRGCKSAISRKFYEFVKKGAFGNANLVERHPALIWVLKTRLHTDISNLDAWQRQMILWITDRNYKSLDSMVLTFGN